MKTSLLFLLVVTLVSCDASTKEFIGSSWRVTDLETDGKSTAVTNEVILTIKSDTEFTLKLDKNSCFGSYELTGNNAIKLKDLSCTEMCCDSEFSMAVASALYKVSKINLNKDRVSLSGENVVIKFKKQLEAKNRIQMMNEDEKAAKNPRNSSQSQTSNTFNTNTKVKQTVQPKGDYITLYKSPCKGSCEEYIMHIFEDGTVRYTGKYKSKVQGKHVVQLPAEKLKSLFQDFENANFNNFQGKYDNERLMDIQSAYLIYKGKKVFIRYRPKAPKELIALLEKVEAQAKEVLEKLKENN